MMIPPTRKDLVEDGVDSALKGYQKRHRQLLKSPQRGIDPISTMIALDTLEVRARDE